MVALLLNFLIFGFEVVLYIISLGIIKTDPAFETVYMIYQSHIPWIVLLIYSIYNKMFCDTVYGKKASFVYLVWHLVLYFIWSTAYHQRTLFLQNFIAFNILPCFLAVITIGYLFRIKIKYGRT